MLEYTANADVKRAMDQAHKERGAALRVVFGWMRLRKAPTAPVSQVSRWA